MPVGYRKPRKFLFGHCVTGFHGNCPGVLDRPGGEEARCACRCHKKGR